MTWRFRDWFGALESGWLSESPGISKKRFAPTATCCSDSAFLLFWYPGKETFPFPPPSPKAKRTSSFTNSSKTNVSVLLTLAGRALKAAKLPIEVELAGVRAIPETSELRFHSLDRTGKDLSPPSPLSVLRRSERERELRSSEGGSSVGGVAFSHFSPSLHSPGLSHFSKAEQGGGEERGKL